MRIAVIETASGRIKVIIAPDISTAPFVAGEGEALVLVETFPEIAELTSGEIVNNYSYDGALQRFVVAE